jgi:hypothetical protein
MGHPGSTAGEEGVPGRGVVPNNELDAKEFSVGTLTASWLVIPWR